MDGLTQLEHFMNSSASDKRKKSMENRSPWSSGSGSTSPLPNRLSLFDKSYSGGSMNSLGSSPGAEVKVLTGQSSLTVPEFNPPTKGQMRFQILILNEEAAQVHYFLKTFT